MQSAPIRITFIKEYFSPERLLRSPKIRPSLANAAEYALAFILLRFAVTALPISPSGYRDALPA
jgi:hypothetical protein